MKTGFEIRSTDELAEMALGHATTVENTDRHFNELARIVAELAVRLSKLEG